MGEVVRMAAVPNHPILVARHGATHRIVLASPPTNALSMAMIEALLTAFDDAAADEACHVVVMAGSAQGFSVGHDLGELTARRSDEDGGRAFIEATMKQSARLAQAIMRHPKPVIAEVAGPAVAEGCQLVASCDLAIAAETATFSLPGVNMGLFCSLPMVAASRSMLRKHAMEMLLTGETIDARTAREFGIVNRVVPPEYLTTVVEKYAAAIGSKPSLAIRNGKQTFYDQAQMNIADAYDSIASAAAESMLGDDARESIDAFFGTERLDRENP